MWSSSQSKLCWKTLFHSENVKWGRMLRSIFQPTLRCLEASPEALLTSRFTEREAAWRFQPSAAINNSIERKWVQAALESFSTDCLLLEGTCSPLWPLFGVLTLQNITKHIVELKTFAKKTSTLKGKETVFLNPL